MRKSVMYPLLLVVALVPATITAIPGEGGSRPVIGYYMFSEPDKQTQMANVSYFSDYYLEDNTYIGTDLAGWGDQRVVAAR